MKFLFLFFIYQIVFSLLHENSFYEKEYKLFQQKYKKNYKLLEESKYFFNIINSLRYKIFCENFDEIEKFNNEKHTWKKGINQFADLTHDEWKKIYLSSYTPIKNEKRIKIHPKLKEIPSKFDWREKDVLNDVENQNECGSCYSFSSMEALQAYNVIYNNMPKIILSKQQIIDCSVGNQGCDGGNFIFTYRYTATHDLCTENEYPYEESEGTCKVSSKSCNYKNPQKSYAMLEGGEDNLLNAVLISPVVIGIDATDLHFYETGILYPSSCKNDITGINHAVVVVGYGTENGNDYWIVRNSWGDSWGDDNGYFKIVRRSYGNGACGIAIDMGLPQTEGDYDYNFSAFYAITTILIVISALLLLFLFLYLLGFIPDKYLLKSCRMPSNEDVENNLLH